MVGMVLRSEVWAGESRMMLTDHGDGEQDGRESDEGKHGEHPVPGYR